MMFLPYIDSEHCTQYGYRYSMSNCVFESALEAVLGKCKCCPIFHMKYCKSKHKHCLQLSYWVNFIEADVSRLETMPYMRNVTSLSSCKADQLHCVNKIFNTMSNYKQVKLIHTSSKCSLYLFVCTRYTS